MIIAEYTYTYPHTLKSGDVVYYTHTSRRELKGPKYSEETAQRAVQMLSMGVTKKRICTDLKISYRMLMKIAGK